MDIPDCGITVRVRYSSQRSRKLESAEARLSHSPLSPILVSYRYTRKRSVRIEVLLKRKIQKFVRRMYGMLLECHGKVT